MLSERIVYLNGDFVAWENATVHIMSHSFGRGSAIFEVISFHDTDSGPVVFRLQEHIKRLFTAAELLDMELPLSHDEFYKAVVDTVKRNNLSQGFIKIICYYPQFSFEIIPPREQLTISIFTLDPAQDIEENLSAVLSTTAGISNWRKLDPQTVPIRAKAAANYLNGMVARIEVNKRGLEHAVMLDAQGFIAEGGTESIFLVKDGKLLTPSLGTILEGISRKSVLQAADVIGIQTAEYPLPIELLYEAEEIFFSCSPIKVLPVRQIEDRQMENTPGPVTRKMAALMDNIATGKDRRFKHWLYPVE
jgi:branched-chain amino acid aminotransferase